MTLIPSKNIEQCIHCGRTDICKYDGSCSPVCYRCAGIPRNERPKNLKPSFTALFKKSLRIKNQHSIKHPPLEGGIHMQNIKIEVTCVSKKESKQYPHFPAQFKIELQLPGINNFSSGYAQSTDPLIFRTKEQDNFVFITRLQAVADAFIVGTKYMLQISPSRAETAIAPENICYKTNEPCKYQCDGLCKDS